MAATITFTTDWSRNDFYSASVKAAILSDMPDAQIITISNDIKSYNIIQAAFILRAVYHRFPKGSIHIIGVRSEASKKHPHCIIKHKGHYFIGSDNGIFGLLFKDTPELIIHLDYDNNFKVSTFPELSIFSKIAIYIAKGEDPSELGNISDNIYPSIGFEPLIDKERITGKIVYIDSYGNAITNITKEAWNNYFKGEEFELFILSMINKITRISNNYSDAKQNGDLIAIFNSLGLLEIASYHSDISLILKIDTNSEIFAKRLNNSDGLFS